MQVATIEASGPGQALRRASESEPLLEAGEEGALARASRCGDVRAFDRLVRAHMRLVFSIAEQYRRFGMPMQELVSEGMLGLVHAARRFDPERGTRLSTYATFWIRSHLSRYTLNNRRIVRGPSTRDGRTVVAHLARCERELSQRDGRRADPEALAAALGVELRELEDAKLMLRARDVALTSGAPEPGGIDLASSEPSPESLVAEREEAQVARRLLARGLHRLNPREQRIVHARRLLDQPRSLAELGASLGISSERVRQLEARGCSKLRDALASWVA